MFLLCHAASRLPVAREEQETRKPFDDTSSVAEEEERRRGGEVERMLILLSQTRGHEPQLYPATSKMKII